MTIFGILQKALAIFMIAGLMAGPFAAPAMAGTMAAGMDMADLSDAMPCCPHEAPPADECQKCPLMAVCAPQILGLPVGVNILAARFAVMQTPTPASDSFGDSLGYDPPSRPPRLMFAA